MNKYEKYLIILIAVATMRLLLFTAINFDMFIILGLGLVFIVLTTGLIGTSILEKKDNMTPDEREETLNIIILIVVLICIIADIVLLNATGVKCTQIEKMQVNGERPEHVSDDEYYSLTCNKGTYIIDDDEDIKVRGRYNFGDPIYGGPTKYERAAERNK